MLLLSEPAERVAHTAELTERRRSYRVRQSRPVKVYEPTTSRHFAGQTQNVSVTGLRVELPAYAPVRAGDVLSVHVGLNQQTGEALAHRRQMIPARVVWVSRDAGRLGAKLDAGVEFLASIAAHLDAA